MKAHVTPAIRHTSGARTLELTRAILLYETENSEKTGGTAIATVHAVETNGQGQRQLAAGTPITDTAVHEMFSTFRRNLPATLLPENLLACAHNKMMWFCPPSRQRLWFAPHRKESPLKALSGEIFPQPGLVFAAEPAARSLLVFAVRGAQRPTPKTKLYRAPYWNIDQSGHLCLGSMRMAGDSPSAIPAIEKAFFASEFTHDNYHITFIKGGHDALWSGLRRRRTFPHERLIATRHTLQSFANQWLTQ